MGLLIFSVVSRIRRAVGGKADEPVLFAPVARRPAPGETPRPQAVPAAPHEPARPDSPVLRYCILAIAGCLVGYPLLAFLGTLDNTGSLLDWVLRSILYLAAIVGAILLSRSGPVWRAPRGAGTLLIVAGAVVFELGMLDMHVFRLFAVDGSNILALMAFHNAGPALAMAGGAVLLYGAARPGKVQTSSLVGVGGRVDAGQGVDGDGGNRRGSAVGLSGGDDSADGDSHSSTTPTAAAITVAATNVTGVIGPVLLFPERRLPGHPRLRVGP